MQTRGARERMRTRLMKRAEDVVDKLLDWSEDTPEPTLTQIEGIVLELREELREEMAREVIEAQERKQPAVGPGCPKCGQEGMPVIACITEPDVIRKILLCVGEPTGPPQFAPPRYEEPDIDFAA